MRRRDITLRAPALLAFAAGLATTSPRAALPARIAREDALQREADLVAAALMREHDISGLAVALTVDGVPFHRAYGVASRETGRPVTAHTLFEVGSVSKVFTAVLASHAQELGVLSLADPASRHVPELRGTAFDGISLGTLGTYAAGGLPLQFPDAVTDAPSMLAYYRGWQPAQPPGTHRRYSNPSIGLLGHATARALRQPFARLLEGSLLPLLGLHDTWVAVPQHRMADYAQGYAKDGRPIRVAPGVLDAEAYGIKTTAADLIRFVQAYLHPGRLQAPLRRALAATLQGHYSVGPMTQGLGWEIYGWPVSPADLVEGNSARMALESHRVAPVTPTVASGPVLVNKTGSTNGFGAYVAFVPAARVGIAILANRNYPNAQRVQAAHALLSVLR